MSLTISEQLEARLTEEAQRQGVSVDALLEKWIREYSDSAATQKPKAPELPAWRLGSKASLRRRGIYNDAD
jgi:hypothetical protein